MSLMCVTSENFTNICRTCFGSEDLGSIFDLFICNIQATYLLEYSVYLKASPQDNLPKNICRNCLDHLYKIYEFKQQCHVNEAILKRLVNETASKDEQLEKIEIILKEDSDAEDYCDQIHHSEESDHDTTEDHNEKDENVKDDGDKYNIQTLFKMSGPTEDCEEKEEKSEQKLNKSNIQQCLNLPEAPYISTTCLDPEKFENVEDQGKSHAAIQDHICEICHKVFPRHYRLQKHMRTHTKEKPYECSVCLQSFSCYSNLKRHERIHTGARPYVCSECGKGFIQSTSLHNHKNTHNAVSSKPSSKPTFKCQMCNRVFKRLGPFNAHLDEHSSDNKTTKKKKQFPTADSIHIHVCHVCARAYKTNAALIKHLVIHGEKKFFCDKCGRGCVSLAALRSHTRMHTGEKPYACTVCRKSFSHPSTLNSHILIHSGHRPHSCSICAKRFTQTAHLKTHMKTHSGERNYTCHYCDKTFASKCNLTVHVRTHTGETPYVCPICEKGFYDSSSMKKHKKKHLSHCTGTETDMVCDTTVDATRKTEQTINTVV